MDALYPSIALELAQALAADPSTEWEDVEFLIRDCPEAPAEGLNGETAGGSRLTMTSKNFHAIVALARFTSLTGVPAYRSRVLPRLLHYLKRLPLYDWEKTLTWNANSPQEACTVGLTTDLLRTATKDTSYSEQIVESLWAQLQVFEQLLTDAKNAEAVCINVIPCLDAYLRALQQSEYRWGLARFDALVRPMELLLRSEVQASVSAAYEAARVGESAVYVRRFTTKRWGSAALPSFQIRWRLFSLLHAFLLGSLKRGHHHCHNHASRHGDVPAFGRGEDNGDDVGDGGAGKTVNDGSAQHCEWNLRTGGPENAEWDDVVRTAPTPKVELSDEVGKALRITYLLALSEFSDIAEAARARRKAGIAPEPHLANIMAVTLKVACLAGVHLHVTDDRLFVCVETALFDDELAVADGVLYKSALDVLPLVANQFPNLREHSVAIMKRFVAEPSHVFDPPRLSPEEVNAVRRSCCNNLAFAIRNDEELATSTMYWFLNSLAALPSSAEQNVGSGIAEVNILFVIANLAVLLRTKKILEFAWSIFQRRPGDDFTLRRVAEIAKFVPSDIFQSIIRWYAKLSKESSGAPNSVSETIIDCQLEIAKTLHHNPEHSRMYLISILTLLVEKGVNMQRTGTSKHKQQVSQTVVAEFEGHLRVLEQVLAHDDFSIHLDPTPEIVSLFRNVWFHCVLYGSVRESKWLQERRPLLSSIAAKTPVLVMESATNYLESDLQYNSVLRRGFSEQDLTVLRSALSVVLPLQAYEIRYFSFAQAVFLLSVYHVETMRAREGDCCLMLRYFANQGVSNSALTPCMEAIANLVCNIYIWERRQVGCGAVDLKMKGEVLQLVKDSAHRLEAIQGLATRFVDKIVAAFPVTFCDRMLVQMLLEAVQLLWQSCESEFHDDYNPTYTFTSPRAEISISLPDSYVYRRELLNKLCASAKAWLLAAYRSAPLEVAGLLQAYISEIENLYCSKMAVHMGRSLALEVGGSFYRPEDSFQDVPHSAGSILNNASEFMLNYSLQRHYHGEMAGIQRVMSSKSSEDLRLLLCQKTQAVDSPILDLKRRLASLLQKARNKAHTQMHHVVGLLQSAAATIIALPDGDPELMNYVCEIPYQVFSAAVVRYATALWTWIIVACPKLEAQLLCNVVAGWESTARHRKGLFSKSFNYRDPFTHKVQYTPSDKHLRIEHAKQINLALAPHLSLIQFLSGRFEVTRHQNPRSLHLYRQLLEFTFEERHHISTHPLTRESRFMLLLLGFKVLRCPFVDNVCEYRFRARIYETAFAWFALRPSWSCGAGKQGTLTEMNLVKEFYRAVEKDSEYPGQVNIWSNVSRGIRADRNSNAKSTVQGQRNNNVFRETAEEDMPAIFQRWRTLLLLFTESEISRLMVWSNPLDNTSQVGFDAHEKTMTDDSWRAVVGDAWEVHPKLAVQLAHRFTNPTIQGDLRSLLTMNTIDAIDTPEALPYLLTDVNIIADLSNLKYLLYWAPVPSVTATSLFSPRFGRHPLVLQYAMRVLEHFPVDTVFFYVPQLVQALRTDSYGYVEKFILGAAKISQLFAHQIIWNMNANMFKDEDSLVPDPLKPTLDRIVERIVSSLSGADKDFYEREFNFFNLVTGISGKLKPFIKKSKPEKKRKIDEELRKIQVDVGVYLPSNPEGSVVDIDYDSGRPLQSHAKAPFLATFKIRKDRHAHDEELMIEGSENDAEQGTVDVWLSAIFKVGDDCRQDVLALQLIALFKSIYSAVGLDLYLLPYRVVATAPGCGVIDVIPKAISRDQIGREKVNNLYDYFLTKYGGLDSIRFQTARNNFVQSLAAYSVILYLLQIKDRHNGNIMLDDEAHIIHIDFGFLLDKWPGSINFESSPFKLTTEMIQVMGGNQEVQPYKWFCELCVKAYLAARPYAEEICQMVYLMLDSGLPCFKGEATIRKLRSRFQPELTERAAANFMVDRIKESFMNHRTVWYDTFQRATNGIPY